MELENLPEIVLLKICRYSDRKSKLNLMEASNFFNEFVGKNPELCKFYLL